ncbi:MAG: T9SS type A sorting domain-containing protein [Ignavibacteriales bacterium]|nr:T9SS type A sorting domain-containing protein [Ignavibacteriales bacterium]
MKTFYTIFFSFSLFLFVISVQHQAQAQPKFERISSFAGLPAITSSVTDTFFDYKGVVSIPTGYFAWPGQFTKDGLEYYFSMQPDTSQPGWQSIDSIIKPRLYVMKRTSLDSSFDVPEQIRSSVNNLLINDTSKYNILPSITSDKKRLFFVRTNEDLFNNTQLVLAERETDTSQFTSIVALSEINVTGKGDAFPWISPNGLRLYYTRDTALGFATRPTVNDTFGNLQSVALDFSGRILSPWLSDDELHLYFARETQPYGIYYAFRSNTGEDFSSPVRMEDLSRYGNVRGPSMVEKQMYVQQTSTFDKRLISFTKRDSSANIAGSLYHDIDSNGVRGLSERGLDSWKILLSGAKVETALTNTNGNFAFVNLPAGNYTVSIEVQTNYVQTAPGGAGIYSFTLDSGEIKMSRVFGVKDTSAPKFRTFKGDVSLSTKPIKIKYSKSGELLTTPNIGSAVEAEFAKIGKTGTSFLGVEVAEPDSQKLYAWIYYKSASSLRKLYTQDHTGKYRPLDSLRIGTRKPKKLKKAFIPDYKMNNPAVEQGIAFNLNIFASVDSVTPPGFGDLLLDTAATFLGRSLQDVSLLQISIFYDSVMTYWSQTGMDNDAAYAELKLFVDNVLTRVNELFYTTMSAANYKINKDAVVERKKPYSVQLLGVKSAEASGFLKRGTPRTQLPAFTFRNSNVKPSVLELEQNYPNPFNPATVISYSLLVNSYVTLKVYDVLGREVATLIQNRLMEEGEHEVPFDASHLSSGVYYYRIGLSGNEEHVMRKMILLK